MPSYTRHAFAAVDDSDLVLEVVDARFADVMRHPRLENHLRARKIPFVVVLNKMDLLHGKASPNELLKEDNILMVPVSCNPKRNISRLRSLIFSRLKEGGKIAVIGFPNAGKSSLINALSGRHAAPTSRQAGFTRGKSLIRLREDVYLIDTPGVIPLDEYDAFKLMVVNAKSVNQLKDVEMLAMELLEWLPTQDLWRDWLFRTYGVSLHGDGDSQLDALAVLWHKVKKGGLPDAHGAAFKLIQDWQLGVKRDVPRRA